jgi:hypothetical protein
MEKPELLCHSLIRNRKYFIVLSLLDNNFLSLYWDSKPVAAADPWKIHGLAYVCKLLLLANKVYTSVVGISGFEAYCRIPI